MINLKFKSLYGQDVTYGDSITREDLYNSDGSKTIPFTKWQHIFERVYCPKRKQQSNSYTNAIIDLRWFSYENFLSWYKENTLDGYPDLVCDTDILSNGQFKVYGPDTCIMIPRILNNILKKV